MAGVTKEAQAGAARTGPIRVLVVDDHPVVREGLETLLAKVGGFVVVARASTPDEAGTMLGVRVGAGEGGTADEGVTPGEGGMGEVRVDVVLCDLFFGGRPLGFDLLTALVAQEGAPPVVLFSQFTSDSLYRTAVEQGAAGYLAKDAPMTEVAQALRTAVAGRSSMSLEALRASRESPAAPNARDRVIIEAVAHGATNAEIADEIGLAPKTVEGRLAAMFRRYDVVSRAELVARALAEGWIVNSNDLTPRR